jgi:hypothetical protein
MIRYFPALACVSAALALGGCWQTNEYPYAQYIQSNCTSPRQACWYANEYPGARYTQRTQTIAMGAGNDQKVNAATQVIDPWNRNVSNSRIPGNGARMVNAITRYRTPPAVGGGGGGINISVGNVGAGPGGTGGAGGVGGAGGGAGGGVTGVPGGTTGTPF